MPGRLTDIVPVARPVVLAGVTIPVMPARLLDLAKIQSWLDESWPDPFDDVLAEMDRGTSGADLIPHLHAALAKFEGGGPPVWTHGDGQDALYTEEGSFIVLAVALDRAGIPLTPREILDLLRAAAPSEMARLRRAFFGVDSEYQLRRMLAPPQAEGSGGELGWSEIVEEVARLRHIPNREVYEMTVPEIRAARCNGKAPDPLDVETLPGESPEALWNRVCLAYYGKPPAEVYGGAEAPVPQRLPALWAED